MDNLQEVMQQLVERFYVSVLFRCDNQKMVKMLLLGCEYIVG